GCGEARCVRPLRYRADQRPRRRRVTEQGGEDPITEPVKVAELPYEEAWLMAGRLRSEDIPATVYPPAPVSIYGMALTRLYSVLVPKELVDDARRVVEEVSKGS